MKIAELKEKLSEFPDDMEVCVDGYESGYDDIGVLSTKCVSFYDVTEDRSDSWWDGRHQIMTDDTDNEDIRTILVIPRRPNR